jgi:hypothetical protein
VVPFDRDESARADPVVEDRRGERASQGFDESSPKVFQHESPSLTHRVIHKCG